MGSVGWPLLECRSWGTLLACGPGSWARDRDNRTLKLPLENVLKCVVNGYS